MESTFFTIHCDLLHPSSFEICALDTSKASGVQKVLEHLQIDKEHSYAFGDGLNDLEMIRYVGHGIAMENAVDELKEIADEVIGHVDEHGLEEYLKTIE
nr:HAD hydrolase family protein [uncultured Faecalibacillus sp.]